MTQTIEVSLIDILNKLDAKIDRLDQKIDHIQKDLTDIKIDVQRLKTENEQIVKRLDSVDNRLNTVTLGVFGLVGVLVTGLLTFVGKFVFFPNP